MQKYYFSRSDRGITTFKFFLVGLIVCFGVCSSYAQNNFWASHQSQSYTQQGETTQGKQWQLSQFYSSEEFALDRTKPKVGVSHFSFANQLNEAQMFQMDYAKSDDQEAAILGVSHGDLSVSFMRGEGDNYSRLSGSYAGIDPFAFHGGLFQHFDFSGFAVDYQLTGIGHLQMGQAEVKSDFLDDRKSRYFEWSNNFAFARVSQFSRSNETIGGGLDAGFRVKENFQMGFQAMRLEHGKQMHRVRFQYDTSSQRQYWLDFSALQNDLAQNKNDMKVMFFFKTDFSQPKSRALYRSLDAAKSPSGASTGKNKKKKRSKWRRPVFIGLGVAAAAVLVSSGSGSSDDSVRLRSQQEAAFDALNSINPVSVRENLEYGGVVFRSLDGGFSATNPVRGTPASVNIGSAFSAVPRGATATASYHTHAAFDPAFDNENFSPTDLRSDIAAGVDGYLATPFGQFKFHNHRTGEIITLGTVANE